MQLTDLSRASFRVKVDTTGGPDACHPWKLSLDKDGYGDFRFGSERCQAHRMAYILTNPDEDIEGLDVDHKCGNRACSNPRHLEAVTHEENLRRRGSYSVTSQPIRPEIDRSDVREVYLDYIRQGHNEASAAFLAGVKVGQIRSLRASDISFAEDEREARQVLNGLIQSGFAGQAMIRPDAAKAWLQQQDPENWTPPDPTLNLKVGQAPLEDDELDALFRRLSARAGIISAASPPLLEIEAADDE